MELVFLPNHVAVLERKHPTRNSPLASVSPDIRTWFAEHTHRAIRNGLDDGSDVDVDRYVSHYLDTITGEAGEPKIFRELMPSSRDVSTALLLDGSSSLSSNGGKAFRIELACVDALSRAMTLAKERHGIFVFSGNTRHRVEVNRLKDFDDRHFADPSAQGLRACGYTRLGAPIRHLTKRLTSRPNAGCSSSPATASSPTKATRAATRADVAHAVSEAEEVAVSVFYIGVGAGARGPAAGGVRRETFPAHRPRRRPARSPGSHPSRVGVRMTSNDLYFSNGSEVQLFEWAYAQHMAGDAHRPHRVRQDPLRRTHGTTAGPRGDHHQLPRRPHQRRPRRPVHGHRR